MSEYRREMEQESFSPEEFVERLAWRTVTSGDFDTTKLHSSFSEAISDLKAILEIQKLKTVQVENSFKAEEQHLRSRLNTLLGRNDDAVARLSSLEKKVNSVATKVVHLGDQLESVNLPRERAAEAANLMKHLSDFLQPGNILLSDVFRDKDRLFEAAEIIQKLLTIVQDLGASSSDSTKFEVALKKISQKYDEIERCLIEEFSRAQRSGDVKRMRDLALILYNFKGYSQCITSFIEQSQFGGFKSKNIFDDVLPLCKLNKPIIEKVFPNPEHVMGKFMLSTLSRVHETVAAQLDRAGNNEKVNPKKFLHNLYHLYSQTKRVVKLLQDFESGAETQFLDQITEQMYRKYMENYSNLEIQSLRQESIRILQIYYDSLGHQKRNIQSSFQDFRRDIQGLIGSRANINIAQIENFGGETFLSEEVAINLLQESRLSYSRCSLLSKKSETATNAAQIFDVLTHALLREHVDYALDLGLQGIPIPDAKSCPVIYFFDIVKRCNAIIHLYEKEFLESLLPLVEATPTLPDCLERKKLTLEHIESKLDAGIDRSLETIVGWVKAILQTEFSQKEVFRADSFNDFGKGSFISMACTKVVDFVNSQVEKMKDSMDGKNIDIVLTELGVRFHRVIYEHLLKFEYSTVGALGVTSDVGQYRECVRKFKSPLLNTLFDTLHALCNLLLSLPSELSMEFNRDELATIDPAIRMNFLQLRTDFKTAKQYLNQSYRP